MAFGEVGGGSSANTHLVDLFYERQKVILECILWTLTCIPQDRQVGAWLGQSGCTPTSVKGGEPQSVEVEKGYLITLTLLDELSGIESIL